jgi:hypothetical protein
VTAKLAFPCEDRNAIGGSVLASVYSAPRFTQSSFCAVAPGDLAGKASAPRGHCGTHELKANEMKNAWGAAGLVTVVLKASPAGADEVPLHQLVFRPEILYFAAAEKGPPETEFYRMENAASISQSTKHSRNGNSAPGPAGGQHSYLFLAVEGNATGQPGISWDGREGALAYANLTDASSSKPQTKMAYGFSVYLPSDLYSHGDNYPPWVDEGSFKNHEDRIFKLTATTLPWVPLLEISANRSNFYITYRGGSFEIGEFDIAQPNQSTLARPNLCNQFAPPAPAPAFPYQHHRVEVDGGASTVNVWHDFAILYKGSSSGADGQIIVWHRTPKPLGVTPAAVWKEWLNVKGPNLPTSFYERNNIINPGAIAAWGYERPSYCYANGGKACMLDCEIREYSPNQPDSGVYIDNIVVGAIDLTALLGHELDRLKTAFPLTDTGF